MATAVGCCTGDGRAELDMIVERCAGLDMHKDTVAACVRTPDPQGGRAQEVVDKSPGCIT